MQEIRQSERIDPVDGHTHVGADVGDHDAAREVRRRNAEAAHVEQILPAGRVGVSASKSSTGDGADSTWQFVQSCIFWLSLGTSPFGTELLRTRTNLLNLGGNDQFNRSSLCGILQIDRYLGHFGQSAALLTWFALCRIKDNLMSFNHLLSQLSKQDLALLEPHIEAIELPYRMPLERRNMIVSQVYFIEAGIASVVATGSFGSNKQSIEVGLIGREGMTGLGVVLGGNKRAVHETFMQVAGSGQRISADNLRQVIAASRTLRQPLLAYAHTFLIQASTTALSNGRSKLEERLARWLLLAHDRIDGDDIKLTHELLGVMLGSHRPGVTLAVQALENRGLIAAHRGYISILDREALEKEANGTYVPPEL